MKYEFSEVLLLLFFFSLWFSPVLQKLPVLLDYSLLILISAVVLEESSLSTRTQILDAMSIFHSVLAGADNFCEIPGWRKGKVVFKLRTHQAFLNGKLFIEVWEWRNNQDDCLTLNLSKMFLFFNWTFPQCSACSEMGSANAQGKCCWMDMLVCACE